MDTLSFCFLFLSLASLAWQGATVSGFQPYGVVLPEAPTVEIGKSFTATCTLYEADKATADDIIWKSGKDITIPRDQYSKINETTSSVTITITSQTPDWLHCWVDRGGSRPQNIHGIILKKGYAPEKPRDVSCVAVQKGPRISPIITCSWNPGTTPQNKEFTDYYTLSVVIVDSSSNFNESQRSGGMVALTTFPHHMKLNITVDVENPLGKVTSDPLEVDANEIVKTNPPSVNVTSERNFSRSLRLEWKHPIEETYLKLKYNIRFRPAAAQDWTEVPQSDTGNYQESFLLQDLRPATDYIVEMRCTDVHCCGYWSDWSQSATARTPEAKPGSKPDVWRVINHIEGTNDRSVQVISKSPVESNGQIRWYQVKFQDGDWESITVNDTDPEPPGSQERPWTELRKFELSDRKRAYFEVIARNSFGESQRKLLIIPKTSQDLPQVGSVDCRSQEDKLWVEWVPAPSNMTYVSGSTLYPVNLSEYVVEWWWRTDGQWRMDWQREDRRSRRAFIRGNLEKYRRYNVSVYPLYNGLVGKPVTTTAFLEEGVPLESVSNLRLRRTGKNDAELEWSEIRPDKQQGFITHYTIYYSTPEESHGIQVSNDTYSYTLDNLKSHTKVIVRVEASTIKGQTNSTELSFITRVYGPGQVEGIIVGVCFGFLFFLLIILLFCIFKKNSIKKIIWPDVPDPSNSTIATWSPDFPSKPDTPKEGPPADVSVVEVDVFDPKSLFEEDKSCVPLKKDKYLSEEHSSGIGGSSCMSSPRQSVSDSDEGGDSGQTTASTVQYSSVVAASASGYKGQTPGPIPPTSQPTFARSESTQPLLDSEEHPDVPSCLEGGSGQAHQRYPRNPYFTRSHGAGGDQLEVEFSQVEMEEEQGGFALLSFTPLGEGSQQTTPTEEGQTADGQATGPASSYRPQLSGYRPQC